MCKQTVMMSGFVLLAYNNKVNARKYPCVLGTNKFIIENIYPDCLAIIWKGKLPANLVAQFLKSFRFKVFLSL